VACTEYGVSEKVLVVIPRVEKCLLRLPGHLIALCEGVSAPSDGKAQHLTTFVSPHLTVTTHSWW